MKRTVEPDQLEHIKAWVKDLETTKAGQTTGSLRKGRKYCCLGRLCVVEHVKKYNPDNGFPPYEVQLRTGLGIGDFKKYADLNDVGGLTFKQIAARVREDFGL